MISGDVLQLLFIPVDLAWIKIFGALLRLLRKMVMVIALMISAIGFHAMGNSFFDVYIMIVSSVAKHSFEFMEEIPFPSIILGIVLAFMIENNLRVELFKSHEGLGEFIFNPICFPLIC